MDLNLKGKVAMVTGGSTGMGAGFIRAFAEEGCDVVINYIVDPIQAIDFSKEIAETYGVRAIAVKADISSEEEVTDLYSTIISKLGRFDILVNSAGLWPTNDFMNISFSEWDKVMKVNINGAFLCSKMACAQFLKQGTGGHIINIGSKSGVSCTSGGHAHYVTSKGATVMFTKALAREMTPHGIIVNCVIPGMVATPMNEKQRSDPNMLEYYNKRLLSGKWSHPSDIANAVVFLASDRAFFTAGSIFDVTGGMLL